jgi:hypothetical protein
MMPGLYVPFGLIPIHLSLSHRPTSLLPEAIRKLGNVLVFVSIHTLVTSQTLAPT